MKDFIIHSKLPLAAEVDVLVIGGGSAGCVAAMAAREKRKHSVLLVERYGFLGGTSTQMLDTFYGFFTPGDSPRKVAGGIPDRIVNALDEQGRIFLRPNTYGAGTGVNYDPEYLKVVWDSQLAACGVKTLLHTHLVDVETHDGSITSAVFYNKSGFFRVKAKRIIDASGDADFCYHAGIRFEKAGDIEPAQTLTTTFRMSNVDLDAYSAAGGKKILMERMDKALAEGTHPLPRKAGSAHAMCQSKCISTVAVRVSDVDATDMNALSEAEAEGRKQAYIYEQFFRDCVPGYEDSNIIGLSHQIGVRETRRVYGEYRLTREDCLSARQFEDKILLCGAPIEDHRKAEGGQDETHWAYVPDGKAYEVPYGTIVPEGQDKVWVVGRCFSATHDAHASCRSMAQTMSMGQAAGFSVSLSLELDVSAREVPVSFLQDSLRQAGAVLDYPDVEARTGKEEWRANFQ